MKDVDWEQDLNRRAWEIKCSSVKLHSARGNKNKFVDGFSGSRRKVCPIILESYWRQIQFVFLDRCEEQDSIMTGRTVNIVLSPRIEPEGNFYGVFESFLKPRGILNDIG